MRFKTGLAALSCWLCLLATRFGRLYRETPSSWVRKMLNPNGDASPKLLNLFGEGSKWRVPTLILHGEQDKLVPMNQSLLLRDQLKAVGNLSPP
jgi:acetyl esterase/lipase